MTLELNMTYIAIVTSILALLVSAATAFFAYRQANSTRDQAEAAFHQAESANRALEIERDRWRMERTPSLNAVIGFGGPAAHRLQLSLTSEKAVTVQSVRFGENAGVEIIGDGKKEVSYGPLNPGEELSVPVQVKEPHPRKVKVEVTCRGAEIEDTWMVPVDAPVFPELYRKQPNLNIRFVLNYPPPHHIEAKLESSEPLTYLELTIADGYGVQFLGQDGQPSTKTVCGALAPGAIFRWPIVVNREHSNGVDCTVTCVGKMQENWSWTKSIEVPPMLARPGKPEFGVELQMVGPERRLKLQLRSLWPLRSIDAEIDSDTGVKFVAAKGKMGIKVKHGSLAPGEAVTWRIDPGQWNTVFFTLNLVCTGMEQEKWSLRKIVQVPSKFRNQPPIPDDGDDQFLC
jgi:hypothetical protein